MQKQTEYLIIALCIAQIISIYFIKNLQVEVLGLQNTMNYFHSTLTTNMDSIYYNIDDMLKKEASLIEDASVEIGEVNTKDLTVPLKFVIIPKEVTEDTEISLDLGDTILLLEKNGVTFSAEISRGFFDDVFPMIIIDENGVKKVTQDERINIDSLIAWTFPIMNPHLLGETRFYDEKTYEVKGFLELNINKALSEVKFINIRLVATVDEQIVLEKIIPSDTFFQHYEIDEQIVLEANQVYIMTVIATDSLGFEHWYTVDHFVEGASIQMDPWLDDEKVYSPSGELIWKFKG